MLRTLRLYGKLREKCGVEEIKLVGDTVAELVMGLSANFRAQLQPTTKAPRMACRIKGHSTPESIREPLSEEETVIHIYPALVGGGGGGGLFKIILGAVLIITFVVITIATAGTGAFAMLAAGQASLTAFGTLLLTTGIGLIIGGLMEMMAPQPKMDMSKTNDVEASKYLGATQNTVRIGTPIPLLIGRHKVYGHFIAFNVDAKNVAVSTTS